MCDNTFWVKRGTVLFMCGIFSKEVLSKHVSLNTASLPNLILVPQAVMSQFSQSMPAGEVYTLRNLANGKD
ncbi:Hypothetical protein AKI40_3539 [Enterobacter sp. FY-07]|nr:Hypothetical protein AKI40_3539 [Enterobacter sp. FY-07]